MEKPVLTLLLIDGSSIARSVYERASKAGASTQEIVRSCVGSFRRSLETHLPTHALVAFDPDGRTFRSELFEGYKSRRPERPKQYLEALERTKDCLSEMGVQHVCAPGFEADDVIATVSLKGVDAGMNVIVQARDIDLLVLLDLNVRIHSHFERTWIDAQWCRDRCGIEPYLVPEWLALSGDGLDGIPGVELVGETTAAKWLNTYRSMSGVIAAAERGELKGKAAQNLLAARAELPLYLQLASLRFDVPVGVSRWRELRAPCVVESADVGSVEGPPEMDPGYMKSVMQG